MDYPYNLDFQKKLVVQTQKMDWFPSTFSGIEKIILEQEAAESGRATCIIRYAPNTFVEDHVLSLGEEIFVLSGEFVQDLKTYSKGTYIRIPQGTKHIRESTKGCVLLSKSGFFDAEDLAPIRIDTTKEPWLQGHGGLQVMPLHNFHTEGTALVKWPAGERFIPHRHWGGEEIFVLTGEFIDEHARYPAGTWMRSPHLSAHCPYVEQETIIFVKTGHLGVK
jgi:anti-sigma factor ChrR (cupin superfamily)